MRLFARVALLAAALLPTPVRGQQPPVHVDGHGVMRWTDSGREVALFGVNYTAPFAYAYRALGYVGADRRAAIDADVAHLARLGLDAYRVHVWDREISDARGNLVDNEHLALLDHLVARLQERGIQVVLTPIFWGGPGYPEPDPPTAGFANRFAKGRMTVDPEAREAQRRYLQQFVRHVNRYTGRSYADDPGILALELFNEPSHPGAPAEVTRYIDELAAAVREAGWAKPVLYNISLGWSAAHARAVCSAAIQGVTFQWYPTGLVRGSAIRTNLLPNVDRYPIPFGDTPQCRDKARVVYEFDAADAAGSYLYPAMARSFRGAGMQWATHFAYDPLAIAHANTEYPTHYLNLVYTPAKAVSLLIAAEAFRRLPRFGWYGGHPRSTRFGPFRVSYAEDLSEMNTPEAFLHSGDTPTAPVDPRALRRVAGYGSSPLVDYPGRGAYFLDRLEAGVWRLEVYPDAAPAADPYTTRGAVSREVTRLFWRQWPMRLRLPDLGESFTLTPVDRGNRHRARVVGGRFPVRPGVYVLRRRGVAAGRWRDPARRVGRLVLGEFHLPARRDTGALVVHRPVAVATLGEPLRVRAEVAAAGAPTAVHLWIRGAGQDSFARLPMRPVRGPAYEAVVPAERLHAGTLEYAVVVEHAGRSRVFPGGAAAAAPGDSLWRTRLVPAAEPVTLFDAARDAQRLLYPHPYHYVRFRTELTGSAGAGGRALRAVVESFRPPPHHFAVRSFLGDEHRARLRRAGAWDVVRVRARSTTGAEERVEIALVTTGGEAWGGVVTLSDQWREVELPLASLRRTPLALLPRPYPEFLPDQLATAIPAGAGRTVDLREVEGVQVRLEAALYSPTRRDQAHGFELESVVLGRAR